MSDYSGPSMCPSLPESIGSLGFQCQRCWRETGTYDRQDRQRHAADIMRQVRCPYCGARAGLKCRTSGGKTPPYPHVRRWRRWRMLMAGQMTPADARNRHLPG